jgi:quinol-cytochrome oxidoreductase complex cytochrome b subunit
VLSDATLKRMFSLHFLLPLLIMGLIIVHLLVLHEYVSSSSTLGRGVVFTHFLSKDGVSVFGTNGMLCILIG